MTWWVSGRTDIQPLPRKVSRKDLLEEHDLVSDYINNPTQENWNRVMTKHQENED